MIGRTLLAAALIALIATPAFAQSNLQNTAGIWFDQMSDRDFDAMEGVCLMAVEAKSEKYDTFLKEFFELSNTPVELQELYYRFCLTYLHAYIKGGQEAIKRGAKPNLQEQYRPK